MKEEVKQQLIALWEDFSEAVTEKYGWSDSDNASVNRFFQWLLTGKL